MCCTELFSDNWKDTFVTEEERSEVVVIVSTNNFKISKVRHKCLDTAITRMTMEIYHMIR